MLMARLVLRKLSMKELVYEITLEAQQWTMLKDEEPSHLIDR
jgi:hypothetical protein